jgi:hypothetical protein
VDHRERFNARLCQPHRPKVRFHHSIYLRQPTPPSANSCSSIPSRLYCGFEDAIEVFDLWRPGEGTRLPTTPGKKSKDGLKGIISALAFVLYHRRRILCRGQLHADGGKHRAVQRGAGGAVDVCGRGPRAGVTQVRSVYPCSVWQLMLTFSIRSYDSIRCSRISCTRACERLDLQLGHPRERRCMRRWRSSANRQHPWEARRGRSRGCIS